ncbi:MAG: AMP-binding protein [Polyangiaceae bacterium]|nr:AMP-binding protein [Polyangiaceae bacterium]
MSDARANFVRDIFLYACRTRVDIMPFVSTLVDLLNRQSADVPDRPALRFLERGEVTGPIATWTYADLTMCARAIARWLRSQGVQPGDRVILLYPTGLEFIAVFFGCLMARVVAVPAWPPEPPRMARGVAAVEAIARDCAPTAVLTTSAFAGFAAAMAEQLPGLAALRLLPTDAVAATTDDVLPVSPDPTALAFLQYTSGSTGSPKGVRVTHANLLANQQMIGQAMRIAPGAEVMGWLPLYHDMGLIGNVIQTIYVGGSLTFISPMHFIERPLRWLEAISRFRAYVSGAPNFAYALCTRKAAGADLSALDLSSWKTAFVGAEPVRSDTLSAFVDRFAPHGFDRRALMPTYGLAEATLFVSGAHAVDGLVVTTTADGPPVVGCGPAAEGVEIAIVDVERRVRQPERVEGEIWVRGPIVTAGYWGDPRQNQEEFGQRLEDRDGWLRTGDLGFLAQGQLYVTGRAKDVLIIRGRNVYPQDLEQVAERASPAVRPGCAAAFAIPGEDGTEAVGLAVEVRQDVDDAALPALAEAIAAAVSGASLASVSRLLLLRPHSLPKTSSGKVRRQPTRHALDQGEIAPRYQWTRPTGRPTAAGTDTHALCTALRAAVAERLGCAPAAVPLDQPLDELGFDSVASMELLEQVRVLVGVHVPAELMAEAPTLRWLADAVGGAPPEAPPVRSTTPATKAPALLLDPSWMDDF